MGYNNRKKKQHYVPQAYLSAWKDSEGNVCIFQNEKFRHQIPNKIAHSRYFYEVNGLNFKEKELLLKGVDKLPPIYKDTLAKAINALYISECLINIIEFKDKIDILRKNIIENFYAVTDDLSATAINILIEEKFELFTVNHWMDLIISLTLQLGRTKKMRDIVRRDSEIVLKNNEVRFDNFYPISIISTCLLIGMRLIEEVYKVNIIINNTQLNFITCDQPVINLLDPGEFEEPKLYFPISPKIAIVLSKNCFEEPIELIKEGLINRTIDQAFYFEKIDESEEDVIDNYNKIILENKYDCIFSYSEADIINTK